MVEGEQRGSNVIHVEFSGDRRGRVDAPSNGLDLGHWEDRLQYLKRLGRFGFEPEDTAFMALEKGAQFKRRADFFERTCQELAEVMPDEQVGDLMKTPSRLLNHKGSPRSPLEAMIVEPDVVRVSAWATLQIETRKNA